MDFYDQFSVLPVVRARNIKILNCFGIIEKRNKMKIIQTFYRENLFFLIKKVFPQSSCTFL